MLGIKKTFTSIIISAKLAFRVAREKAKNVV
jgi:hypothetical protein